MFSRSTLTIIFSSALVAILAVLQVTRDVIPVSIISAGLYVGNTLFHEIGHSIFSWLFGMPSLPAIFTLFGADQAGGVTLMWDRQIILQILVLAGLGYLCYRLRSTYSPFYKYALGFTIFIAILAISGYHQLIINYMGHGSSIMIGGFFLFRAWVNIQARHTFERWLNGLFGVFLIFHNLMFSYRLIFDPVRRWDYSRNVSSIGHHDFVKIAKELNMMDVQIVAWFTLFLSIATFVIASICAKSYLSRAK
ncbi:MAG: hypothetical protein OEY09_17305 [Gammaproteobacteria bacterium]|nr:hypothetical protein [Gammaproteobacteria bacterium]